MAGGRGRRGNEALTAAQIEAVEGPLAAVVGLINASTARLVELIAEALVSGVWEQAGIRSPEHWVAWKVGVSARRAKRLVAMARRRAELPITNAAFTAGALSEDQVAEVALHVPAVHDAEVADLAQQSTVAQLRTVVRGYAFAEPAPEPVVPTGEPVAPETPEGVVERNDVSFGYGDDGRWWLRGDLDPELGALVERALQACRDAELHDRHPDGDGEPSPHRVTWADALVRLCDAALAGLAGDRPVGERYQVVLHVRADREGAPTSVHLGPALPAGVRRLLGCDSTVRYLLERGDGVPLQLGRRQRTVSAAQRTIIEDRYGGRCARPGCERSRGLHIHHLVHWEDGGGTDLDNLVPLCGADHRLHHLGLLGIAGDPSRPGGLVFTDHHGRVLSPGADPVPPDPATPLDQVADDLGVAPGRWEHPPGERLDTWWITFRDPPEAA